MPSLTVIETIGCVLALLLAFTAGWIVRDWKDTDIAQKQELTQQQAVIHQQDKSNTINWEVDNDFQKRLDGINHVYDGLLTTAPDPVPAVSGTSCVTNGAAHDNQFASDAKLLEVERQEDRQAAELIDLQAWVKQQGKK